MYDMNLDICERLKKIFLHRFQKDLNSCSEEILDNHLLGKEIQLAARDLLYVYFDVEKEFGITIPEDDIAADKFNTFNNIAEIICNQLQKKEKEAV